MELSQYNIRVNSIAPGFVDTSGRKHTPNPAKPERNKYRAKHETLIPLGSYAIPDQVAGIAVFLASDDAIYITGSNIVADGGARLPVVMDTPVEWLPDSVTERRISILKKQGEEEKS